MQNADILHKKGNLLSATLSSKEWIVFIALLSTCTSLVHINHLGFRILLLGSANKAINYTVQLTIPFPSN